MTMREMLEQLRGERWNGEPVSTLSRRHAANVVGWLERRARRLHYAAELEYMSLVSPRGEMAELAYESGLMELMELDPLVWLNEQQLMAALRERAGRSRGGPSLRYRARRLVGAV